MNYLWLNQAGTAYTITDTLHEGVGLTFVQEIKYHDVDLIDLLMKNLGYKKI